MFDNNDPLDRDLQHAQSPRHHHHPHLPNLHTSPFSLPPSPEVTHHRSASFTPASSPGIFNMAYSPDNGDIVSPPHVVPETTPPTPAGPSHNNSHLLSLHPVRETHIANVERDYATGRKTINEYQVIEEIGRGQHGKVKLARDSLNGHLVAIKIIPRLSKTRRLGKVSAVDPQQNTKREIAILKKIRHENVVALLEVIDDPELQKIYMVLEHVERGEVVWRKKGLPNICYFERYRIEKGMHGQRLAPGEVNWSKVLERKATISALKEARAKNLPPPVSTWTTDFGVTADDDDQLPWWYVADGGPVLDALPRVSPLPSRDVSRAPSRVPSSTSVRSIPTPLSCESESVLAQDGDSGMETPSLLHPNHFADSVLDGSMYGPYIDDAIGLRRRSPSMAESVFSHISSFDYNSMVHDPYTDDFSYVPCFNVDQARCAFRDTVLGLEYLHYHGVVHRDIKPANLLWTRNFHVKISDFGVSYFGRPIRDGEQNNTVSEAEALDFDDDRELSKTVGTPAFFAPELCYTDINDIDKEPPRVSEQIDVWSLGVTLYCLLYARIPFLAEDEFSMFRKIATEEAFIPDQRLKPVGIFTDPTESSLYQRTNVHPYRNDADPEYEQLNDALLDLLKKMLTKNPEKRIRLRDVKRHKWVTEDIDNVPAWLEATDPARQKDHRIQVDDAEIGEAVVPLNFLQRARSAVKRAVDKVMHGRPERDESAAASPSRRRASSSVASSAGDSTPPFLPNSALPAALQHGSHTSSAGHNYGLDHSHLHSHSLSLNHHQTHHHHHHHHRSLHHHASDAASHSREGRRRSLRGGDDYFATVTQMPCEHPLSQSVTVSPYASPGENIPSSESARELMSAGEPAVSRSPETPGLETPGPPSAVSSEDDLAESERPASRHTHSRSITNAVLSRAAAAALLREVRTVPPTPAAVDKYAANSTSDSAASSSAATSATTAIRRTREGRSVSDAISRTRSVDRGGIVVPQPDMRAGPVVGVNPTYAPGSVQQPGLHRPVHSIDITGNENNGAESAGYARNGNGVGQDVSSRPPSSPLPSPQFFSPAAITSYHRNETVSDPNSHTSLRSAIVLDERPATSHRVQSISSAEIGRASRNASKSISVSSPLRDATSSPQGDPAGVSYPPSPMSSVFTPGQPRERQHTGHTSVSERRRAFTAASSSSTSIGALSQTTPLTSPSEATNRSSFVTTTSGPCKEGSNPMLAFQSDPSLPALLSGASSVSADVEGEFLGNPGVVDGTPLIDASDSLTPPALDKETVGFHLDQNPEQPGLKDQQGWGSGGAIPVKFDAANTRNMLAPRTVRSDRASTDGEDDSDSDGGIVMAKSKKRGGRLSRDSTPIRHGGRAHVQMARRRDTNTSIGSTDTAKKVPVHYD